ncbi:unnamed protein product, partial [marine sediment metagenome]
SYVVDSVLYVGYEGSPSTFANYTSVIPTESFLPDVSGELHVAFPGMIKEHILGYSDHSDFCSVNPEGIVRVQFIEQLTFDGIGLDLHDDVIAYNIENSDRWGGFEVPLDTAVQLVKPEITKSITPPALPGSPVDHLGDLWFNLSTVRPSAPVFADPNSLHVYSTRVMGLLIEYYWKPIQTAYWYECDFGGDCLGFLHYRTMGKCVDTGWVLSFANPIGFNNIQPAVGGVFHSTNNEEPEDSGRL